MLFIIINLVVVLVSYQENTVVLMMPSAIRSSVLFLVFIQENLGLMASVTIKHLVVCSVSKQETGMI